MTAADLARAAELSLELASGPPIEARVMAARFARVATRVGAEAARYVGAPEPPLFDASSETSTTFSCAAFSSP